MGMISGRKSFHKPMADGVNLRPQDYERLAKSYRYGLSKIYELVINNDPCYAYLMQSNAVVDQKLVMAHVFGHCDFFKNNAYFSVTNRKMMDEMANHATRIRKYIDRWGIDMVEGFAESWPEHFAMAYSAEDVVRLRGTVVVEHNRIIIDTTDLTLDGAPPADGIELDAWPQQPSGPELAVLHVQSLTVEADAVHQHERPKRCFHGDHPRAVYVLGRGHSAIDQMQGFFLHGSPDTSEDESGDLTPHQDRYESD